MGVRLSLIARLVVGGAFVASCDKSVQPTEIFPTVQPSSEDPDAGTWRMIVLTGPDQVAVPAPATTSSAAYVAEVAAVKSAQANATPEQQRAVAYWSGDGVLRWNEIERELVARYNLPPIPRADGTYPLPDAENPFGLPEFPFSNPPYAARAYSYVSVAQYEALKAAWYWKFRYNRAAPSAADPAIVTVGKATGLPSYPSEDAVLSGVTAEMLKLLFPAAVEEITRKAAEQREAAVLSGRATASDVAAGLALGKAVAAIVAARASADGMKNAVGTATQWQALADGATSRGELAWKSLEAPVRPPMLPNFGLVRTWAVTPDKLVAIAPPPPPATSSAEMRADVEKVRDVVNHLTRDQIAIAQKWNDGAGTYTPPGHWNAIAAAHVRDAQMSEVRAARVFALLNMAMHDAAVACWGTKFQYFNPRPSQLDPLIKTVIGLPNFPAYPSGHSTFSGASAQVLGYLFPSDAQEFESMADEAGISRVYGGIHFPTDVQKGKEHGQRIGSVVVAYAKSELPTQ
ncbi:MAG TPA: phosphatase PAP2 family protein [Gemmatimonadaceae bacterium]|nr:phosphatase PAP2 family protein [Gemmatimonadaceae bacterium]